MTARHGLMLMLVFGTVLLALSGCRSIPVEITSLTGPDSLRTQEAGTFRAEVNADAPQPTAYAWTFGDQRTATGSLVSHQFAAPGTYTVEVTATDAKERSSDRARRTVVVYTPLAPPQVVSLTATPLRADTRTPVRFAARIRSDAPATYAWSLGDGTTSSADEVTHTFATPGRYTVALEVANAAGVDQRTVVVEVDAYEAPFCRNLSEMSPVFFDRNSSTLKATATAALQENLDVMLTCPNLNVRIQGWAAPDERNAQRLSEDRARVVEAYYIQGGLLATRIASVGNGTFQGASQKEEAAQYRRADSLPTR